ncbi:MAG: hypothetical protein LBS84_09680 [Clostridiales bacterium]|nr:hypothetical protein [Clostridiales bacterium]
MSELKAKEYKRFEDIKRVRTAGGEYWLARELAPVLEYTNWQNFSKVIDRAMLACKNSGNEIDDHFIEASKMVDIGSGAKRIMGSEELVSNLFRISQTDSKLKREGINNREDATDAHPSRSNNSRRSENSESSRGRRCLAELLPPRSASRTFHW